mmetsp:Transcript_54740/g.177865  ORF Transcript_54740/g.177865 Transcript_54740/m.177865 type:complete len:294 (-) Transcript_54740:1092-1973(-)
MSACGGCRSSALTSSPGARGGDSDRLRTRGRPGEDADGNAASAGEGAPIERTPGLSRCALASQALGVTSSAAPWPEGPDRGRSSGDWTGVVWVDDSSPPTTKPMAPHPGPSECRRTTSPPPHAASPGLVLLEAACWPRGEANVGGGTSSISSCAPQPDVSGSGGGLGGTDGGDAQKRRGVVCGLEDVKAGPGVAMAQAGRHASTALEVRGGVLAATESAAAARPGVRAGDGRHSKARVPSRVRREGQAEVSASLYFSRRMTDLRSSMSPLTSSSLSRVSLASQVRTGSRSPYG